MSVEAGRIHCLRPLIEAPTAEARGPTSASISDAMVALLRARTGRGPTKAKTAMGSDLALVTLRECLTTAEKTLAREGHGALTIKCRDVLYEGLRGEAIAAVEAITGRQVAAYFTAHELDPDLTLLAFHFRPRSAAGP